MNSPQIRSLSRVQEWHLNPRQGSYENVDELKDSIQRHGLQDAIHVWERPEADLILKGHRRVAAMRALGWQECAQVVHHFADSCEAYRYLLEDHGHTSPLNNEEKITAVQNGVKLGLNVTDLAPSLGISEDRVQMLFDLGEALPPSGREALARGTLSLHVAELVLQVQTVAERKEAVQLVLHDTVNNEPLAFKAAKRLIEMKFILPRKWLEAWVKKSAALKKKHRVSDGFIYVDFNQRMEYVLGDSGQPQPEFELADNPMPKDPQSRLWGEVAKELEVPIYITPAPLHCEGYVMLVQKRMIRDALDVLKKQDAPADEAPRALPESHDQEDAADEAAPVVNPSANQTPQAEDAGPAANEQKSAPVNLDDDALGTEMRVKLGLIFEHLSANPTDCMSQGPWRLLHGFLARLVTDVDAGACEAWLGITDAEKLKEWIGKDKVNRSGMRIALMLLLCAESDASEQPMQLINTMLEELGIKA